MNRYVTSAIAISSTLLVACGGKGAGAKGPAPASDPCAAGVHASGVTGKAANWDAVIAFAGSTADEVCSHSPCGPDEAYSFVVGGGVAVEVDAGYTLLPEVWDGVDAAPTATRNRLGELVHLSLDIEQLGREEVVLDDGETTTSTVLIGHGYVDYVIDPAFGTVLWRASCWVQDDAPSHPTAVTRDGDTFTYGGCTGDAPPVGFTAAQAARCPAE